jgi:hypothetical protein
MGGLSGGVEGRGKGDTVDTTSVVLKLENIMNDIGYNLISRQIYNDEKYIYIKLISL